jgi:ABC-2 type transport system ATP-binding protein
LSNATPEITLYAQNLTRSFAGRLVIHDFTLQLKRGEVLGLLGPNGAGKSTTLQMLTGCLLPDSGTIEICGINLQKTPVPAKEMIGYLPESLPLYRELCVNDYLIFAAGLRGIKSYALQEALENVKQRCGLESVGQKVIATLSKGYQQRVGIAQAIIHQPAVMILDEPTVGLDPAQIRDIRHLIRELGNTGSVILSTHLLGEVENVCDRVEIIQHGKLIYSDTSLQMQHYGKLSGFVISLRNPPALETLALISGVTSVEQMSTTKFRILHAPEQDTVSILLGLAAQHGWHPEQLMPLQTTLEDIYVKITSNAQGERK